jgi:hypothetical protein
MSQLHLGSTENNLKPEDFDELAAHAEGYVNWRYKNSINTLFRTDVAGVYWILLDQLMG